MKDRATAAENAEESQPPEPSSLTGRPAHLKDPTLSILLLQGWSSTGALPMRKNTPGVPLPAAMQLRTVRPHLARRTLGPEGRRCCRLVPCLALSGFPIHEPNLLAIDEPIPHELASKAARATDTERLNDKA